MNNEVVMTAGRLVLGALAVFLFLAATLQAQSPDVLGRTQVVRPADRIPSAGQDLVNTVVAGNCIRQVLCGDGWITGHGYHIDKVAYFK